MPARIREIALMRSNQTRNVCHGKAMHLGLGRFTIALKRMLRVVALQLYPLLSRSATSVRMSWSRYCILLGGLCTTHREFHEVSESLPILEAKGKIQPVHFRRLGPSLRQEKSNCMSLRCTNDRIWYGAVVCPQFHQLRPLVILLSVPCCQTSST